MLDLWFDPGRDVATLPHRDVSWGARPATLRGMRALWNGQLLADSDRTIEIDGYVYFPRESVAMERLRPATKTSGDRVCPHGVQFYDLLDGSSAVERQAWSYEKPGSRMQPIDHWLGFWDEVEVTA
jgi:uncharacterized protein (DUF427 family)